MDSKQVKRSISSLAGFLPVEKLMLPKRQQFVFPFWHAVSDAPPPHLSQLYRVPTIPEFERDLDFFLKNYSPSTIEDVLMHTTNKGKMKERFFFPSFDDGLAECYQVIAPILKKKGIQAAFFINPSFVDNKVLFHRHKASLILKSISENEPKRSELSETELLVKRMYSEKNLLQFLHQSVYTDHSLLDQIAEIFGIDFNHFLANHKPYMTLGQIEELQADGFLIGAHSMDHREFFLSSEDEINRQISASMEFLIREINPLLKTFAFPYTDFKVPDSVFEKARQSKTWDLSFGTAGMKDEAMPNHIQRIPMETDRITDGKQVLLTEYIWYFLKSLLGKNKVRR